MLMFAFELQRRSDGHSWGLLSLAAHPGLAATALGTNRSRLCKDCKANWQETLSNWLGSVLEQSASDAALPTLFAATSLGASKAGYYGPTGFIKFKGPVGKAKARCAPAI
jgi:hypothetical protein